MIQKFCPKCLTREFETQTYCAQCGTLLIEWSLKCICGAEIDPVFRMRIFPPWSNDKIPLYKYCPKCGKKIDSLIQQTIVALKEKEKYK